MRFLNKKEIEEVFGPHEEYTGEFSAELNKELADWIIKNGDNYKVNTDHLHEMLAKAEKDLAKMELCK